MSPQIIYSLWLQGVDRAPELVRLCLRRWQSLNPSYEMRVLDASDVRHVLGNFPVAIEALTPQALSDIVRTRVLHEGGGIWVDATLLPLRPLEAWLTDEVAGPGFFAFERPQPDRALASWFLAANPRHPMMNKLWQQVALYWSTPRRLMLYNGHHVPPDPEWEVAPEGGAAEPRYPYFWFHYLFGYLLKTDREFATLWSQCHKWSARLPHSLQGLFASQATPEAQTICAVAHEAPVQKLSWRRSYPLPILERL